MALDTYSLHCMGATGRCNLPRHWPLWTIGCKFQYPVVLEWHEQAVVIQCCISYLLHPVEVGHPVRASHDPEYFTQVSTFDKVQCRLPFYVSNNTRWWEQGTASILLQDDRRRPRGNQEVMESNPPCFNRPHWIVQHRQPRSCAGYTWAQ